jgi:LmbE family N-acetylglucosaminyl deacetylase
LIVLVVAELRKLHDAASRASREVGARSLTLEKLPDNRFDELPLLDIVKLVEAHIERLRPELVLTHHPGDLNVDHRMTFEAALTATRPIAGQPVRTLLSFEIPSSSEWSFHRIGPEFRPNVFVDVSSTIERKMTAMREYAHEMHPFPHPRSAEALTAIAMRWGSVAGLKSAEAFELVRAIDPELFPSTD